MIHFDIGSLEKKHSELENQTMENGFWDDAKKSGEVLKELNSIKGTIESYKKVEENLKNIDDYSNLISEEIAETISSNGKSKTITEDNDVKNACNESVETNPKEENNTKNNEGIETNLYEKNKTNGDSIENSYKEEIKEIIKETKELQKEIEKLQIDTLLSGKYDKNNAILTIHPGAGGTEAQDWAEMLYRMYSRWAEQNGYGFEVLDYLAGEEAGIKSVSFLVSGEFAYGKLKSEHGVHRLVRISPFDAGGRRHTSFASVEVLPEIDDDSEIYIRPEDIKMDVYRSSGAGGQHINKTSSAVRLTHIPTGIVVSCQTQRSQFQNRDTAMKMLKSKLINLKEAQNKERIEDLKGNQMDIAWGSQIRSYVFCPYTLVKDHRTNFEVGDVQKVMDGDLNGFIKAYLIYNKKAN